VFTREGQEEGDKKAEGEESGQEMRQLWQMTGRNAVQI